MRTEFRYALRSLLRDRAFTLTVVLSLALGIGANTSIFSLIDGILLRPPDYREPDRLVSIAQIIPKFAKNYPVLPTNIAIFKVWQQKLTNTESVAIAQTTTFNLTGSGQPEQLTGALVSSGWFQVFGVRPRVGRDFTTEEEQQGHDGVVMIGERLWRRRFQADPRIAGRKILLNGRPFDIVGVVPASFLFPAAQAAVNGRGALKPVEVYKPAGYAPGELKVRLNNMNYWAAARLKPGVTLAHAQAELNVVQAEVDRQIEGNFEVHARMAPLMDSVVGSSRQGLLLVMAAVGAVLLVLIVNLANLSLARAAGRARDAAIRTAIGASQARLVRQSLIESVMLAALGGILAILLAWWGVNALVAAAPVDLPRLSEVHVDWRVLLFAALVSVIAGIAFGVLPAIRTAWTAPIEALKSGSRSNTEGRAGLRVRNLLVSLEVGLSAALLVIAGLLIGSFTRVMTTDRGFAVERVLALDVSLLPSKYKGDAPRSAFFDRLLQKAVALPGVQSASITSALPLSGETWIDLIERENETRPPTELPASNVRFISPEYFSTLRVQMRDGRNFEERDRQSKVAIISASLAKRLWGDENPIGRRLKDNDTLSLVVGVTPDFHSTSLDHEPVNMLYIPYWQRPRTSASLLLRTVMEPRQIVSAARAAVWELDGEVTIPEVRTLQEVMTESVGERRFQMLLILLFAAAAMALAAIGTYGVLSYAVARRTSEMGIRMALGATPSEVLAMVLRQGMMPVATGLVVGAAGALAVGRYLESLLYQMSPRDPMAFGASAALLVVVSIAACLIPARRATQVNPMDALRSD
jgi:predicted permease